MASSSNMCMACLRAARLSSPRSIPGSQLQARRSITTSQPATTSVSPAFDFLAPARRTASVPAARTLLRYKTRQRVRQVQPFSTTAPARRAILNPRKDEDGNDMDIEITPRAANRLKQIMTKDSNPSLALRVSVESGGCHGFQYLMSLTDMSKISPEEDTVFEGNDGAKVVMDEPSLELLKGSKVDYTMELIGSQFKIVDNPLATSSCGCGTSFDIKA